MSEPTVESIEQRRELRQSLRARRRVLGAAARLRAAGDLAAQLAELPALQQARRIAGYWAMDGELSLHALLSGRVAERYYLPCIQPDRSLRFAAWRVGAPLQPNRFGIPEPSDGERLAPEQIDLVLLPLVGFDRRGNRLGSGAGFYDRSFAFLREQARPARPLLVGIGYGFQQIDALPAQPWDVPLDYVATEAELIRCVD